MKWEPWNEKKNLIRVEILVVSAQFIWKKPGILDEKNRENREFQNGKSLVTLD